jgi:hypothetical protein
MTWREVLRSRWDRSPEVPCEPITTAAASRSVATFDNRVGHVQPVRDRVGFGIQAERSGELSALASDHGGTVLLGGVKLGYRLWIGREWHRAGRVQTASGCLHRRQARLPDGHHHRGAAGEELRCTTQGGLGKFRAVVADDQPRLPAGDRHDDGPVAVVRFCIGSCRAGSRARGVTRITRTG